MKTTVKLYQLRNIAFAQQGQVSLVERLYIQKPERGGAKIAYRIAALRGTTIRLLGPESAFESTRTGLIDKYHDSESEMELRRTIWVEEHKDDKPVPPIPKILMERVFKSSENPPEFFQAINDLFDTTEEIDVELFPVDAIDAAGYCLSGAEIDALMGLLVQPETTPEGAA